jgi:radical SAM/Cys-rich protein
MSGFGFPPLSRAGFSTLQFNVGRLCNQACLHCHVESSPSLTQDEYNASPSLINRVIDLLAANPDIQTLDLTGGAPELNPGFRRLVSAAYQLQRKILVRHNLTVQGEKDQSDLPHFFAEHGIELFCSLPCYLEENVNKQRGNGVFSTSISALQKLNDVGYGMPDSLLKLNLVYNPIGDSLPPSQQALEDDYRHELRSRYSVEFSNLVTITNQPIHRFEHYLQREQRYDSYMKLLRDNFNPETLPGLMCRSAISLRWDGKVFDCDFNLVKGLAMVDSSHRELTIDDLLSIDSESMSIAVDGHCFACTAGAGSSCGGSLVQEV